MYVCIYISFFSLIVYYKIIEYSSLCYGRSFLVIYFICSSVPILIPYSYYPPPPFPLR